MYNCTKCDMSMWSDEILDNDWCTHDFPYKYTSDYKQWLVRNK